MKIVNLTQHQGAPEQGVIDLTGEKKTRLVELLNFVEMPNSLEILQRAEALAQLAVEEGGEAAMIGGAPFLMSALEKALKEQGVKPLYAFSRRESVEKKLPNGSVEKVAVFRHRGFVEP